MRPRPRRRIKPQKNVGGEKPAKKHYFRSEKKPDANLGIPKTGVGTSGDRVRNFHCVGSSQNWLCWQLSSSAFRRFHRFVLHREIAFAPREAVFVGTAIGDRCVNEVPVRR